jgi:ubiquinone/menaquinone biosynthesis C-methylase UbiE
MSRADFWASPFGVVYSAYMERPWLSRLISRAVWGGDSRAYYESMDAVAGVASGGTIIDCPCGAGPAFRGLDPARPGRYVAADLSPSMLRRARKRAAKRGLRNVDFIQADATELPLPAGSADLFLSFWGLHCFDDPQGALIEAARVLKPEGRFVAAAFVRGEEGRRQRLLVRPGLGDFGQVGTEEEVLAWLEQAGLQLTSRRRSGPMLFLDARVAAEAAATGANPE